MPFVPVVSFWSTRESVSLSELEGSASSGGVRVTADDAAALGWSVPASAIAASADEIKVAVREDGVMGILRATDVDQSVRALGIGDVNLFGNDRIQDVSQWPLVANVQSSEAWDQSASWTLVAVGDMHFDRLVRKSIEASGSRSYPFDGGTAEVSGLRCCSYFNYQYPIIRRTGNQGAMRALIGGADLAIGNLETGVLEDAVHHADPFSFTFHTDASWMQDLASFGFDMLSTANNHSNDAGQRGMRTAIDAIAAAGMQPAGSGFGEDVFAPAFLEANGTTVAIIACTGVRGDNTVQPDPDSVLAMSCNDGNVARVIRETRDSADVVMVYPHWGREYMASVPPRADQREQAAQWVAAGADLVVGHHSHFPGGIQDIDGKLVMYSLGNFIFDQDFRQATMMGLVPEMTFNGSDLKQVWIHTTLIFDNAQPNLADPNGDGQFAFDLVREGSRGLLDY
jgi:poly-gamma-glutamate synthesis protein (capsule biosynthesis protein)